MSSGVSETPTRAKRRHPVSPGRPKAVALTPRRLKLIIEKVENGVPPQTAAGTLGIPRATWHRWLTNGREENAIEPYKSLAEKVSAAVDVWHESRVKLIQEAAVKDPRHAEWMLERRLRDEYGMSNGDVNVQINLAAIMQSPDWRDLRDRLLRCLAPFPDAFAAVVGELGGLPAGEEQRQIAA